MPNTEDATWTYAWYDNTYSNALTYERYTVAARSDATVRLAWTTDDAGNGEGAVASNGFVDYRYNDSGLTNANWSSTPPPPQFPVLCAQSGPDCGNSLAGSHYHVIWGSRSPVLQEPLVRGATWTARGGQSNDVASVNRYLGVERIVVPAFPLGINAAKVESDISQIGSLGDKHGTGLRTTWWVYGVGPVKVAFRHAGGEYSEVQLYTTNLLPKVAPSDKARLPFIRGQRLRYRYTNRKHLPAPSRQEFTVVDVANGTARVDVRELSGPIAVRGSYFYATGLGGVASVSVATRGATRAKLPKLGPRSLPATRRRRFYTPLDLMNFGYNPILTAYPKKGDRFSAPRFGRDWRNFEVEATAKVIGNQSVRTPAGRYIALLVESKLRQKGFPFGSGTRRMWFAPGVGLVKLEFRHGDGSVSRVDRLPS